MVVIAMCASKAHFAPRRKLAAPRLGPLRTCGRCCKMVLFASLMSTPPTPPASSLSALVRRLSDISIVRFGIVGVSNTAIGAGAFWSAHRVMRAAAAQGIAYTLGTLWSYYWNRRWTFQSQGKVAGEAGRFFTLQIGFMLLSSALLGVLVDQLHLPSLPCWLGVAVFITVLNFVASRYWAFKPRTLTE